MHTFMRSKGTRLALLLALILTSATGLAGQAPVPDPASSPGTMPEFSIPQKKDPTKEKAKDDDDDDKDDKDDEVCKGNFFENLLCDQKAIWTSPGELRARDARWLVPLGLGTAGFIATDRRTAGSLDKNPDRLRISNAISYAGDGRVISAFVVGTYLVGRGTSNVRLRRTGKLAAESLINASVVTFAFKGILQRQRPDVNDARGRFFTSGDSHPSGHSAAVWSVATVFACQYKDKPLIHYGAYAAAGAVGISRFTAQRHFLSDILVGSALGYGVGRYVCRMNDERNPANKKPDETGLSKFLPGNVSGRFDRRNRDYWVGLAWSF